MLHSRLVLIPRPLLPSAPKHTQDLVAYLRVAASPKDDVAFLRILNVPPRKLGAVAAGALRAWASAYRGDRPLGASLLLLGEDGGADGLGEPLPSRKALGLGSAAAHDGVVSLVAAFSQWRAMLRSGCGVAPLLRAVLRDTGYRAYLEGDGGDDDDEDVAERWGNVEGLLAMAAEFDAGREPLWEDEDSGGAAAAGAPPGGFSALAAFLQSAALMTDADSARGRDAPGRVRLQTIHSAKGLEYDAVFVVGLEDTVLPSARGLSDAPTAERRGRVVEEERRLLYVAATRARTHLALSHARQAPFDPRVPGKPCRFLAALDRLPAGGLERHVEPDPPPRRGFFRKRGA